METFFLDRCDQVRPIISGQLKRLEIRTLIQKIKTGLGAVGAFNEETLDGLAPINDDIFNAAFTYFPQLQLLDVPGLKLVSRSSIESLVREQPSRVIIHQEKVYISHQMRVS